MLATKKEKKCLQLLIKMKQEKKDVKLNKAAGGSQTLGWNGPSEQSAHFHPESQNLPQLFLPFVFLVYEIVVTKKLTRCSQSHHLCFCVANFFF